MPMGYRGTSLIRIRRRPQDYHRALGQLYCRVLRGGGFVWTRYPCKEPPNAPARDAGICARIGRSILAILA